MAADLTPFGFTPTESLVYQALLKLGPATGYAVAQEARLARANAYGALEGLVVRGAATRATGRPARYRSVEPAALLAQLAAAQGAALDRLAQALRRAAAPGDPVTREVEGARAVSNVIMQIVARAESSVAGVIGAELWRPSLPAWRRAAARASLAVRIAGQADDPDGLAAGTVSEGAPTVLVVDDAQALTATGLGDETRALWSSHPLIVQLARVAIAAAE
jgi:HTH-type transcriptional regulator, sugar sensing transcriptional regulator